MTRGKSESLIAPQSSILLLLEGLLFTQNFMGCLIIPLIDCFCKVKRHILIIINAHKLKSAANGVSEYDSDILDYDSLTYNDNQYVSFDLTKTVNEWYDKAAHKILCK